MTRGMEFVVSWDTEPEDVLITTSGVPAVDDVDAMIGTVRADPHYRGTGLRALLDHRGANFAALSPERARERADRIVDVRRQLEAARIAVVVARPADYGVQRVLDALIVDHVPFETAVFYSLEDARAWLTAE